MTLEEELAAFVAPLAIGLDGAAAVERLLRDLGLHEGPQGLTEVPDVLEDLAAAGADALAAAGGDAARLAAAVAGALAAVADLRAAAATAGELAPPFDAPALWEALADALPGYLLGRWLGDHHPVADALLRLTGVVTDAGPACAQVDFRTLGALLTDPPARLAEVAGDDVGALLPPLRRLLIALGAGRRRRRFTPADPALAAVARPVLATPPAFGFSLVSPLPGEAWAIEGELAPVSVDGLAGLQLLAGVTGAPSASARLSELWTLEAELGAPGSAGVVLVPGGLRPVPGGTVDTASLALDGRPPLPWALVGAPGASRLELASLTFALEAERLGAAPELAASLATDALRVVIAPGDGDSFIADVLGEAEIAAEAALSARWSSADGFALGAAGAGLEVTIPVERRIGPVTIHTVRVGVAALERSVGAELAADLGVALGPLALVVRDVGLTAQAAAAAAAGRGGFGDLDFGLVAKPPVGVGLLVEAGVVTGGGFLDHPPGSSRYSGGAELDLLGTGLVAIGVLETVLPGGASGWSLFLSLGIRLSGVQLGFGFTLNGVGGLLGINRGLDDDALGDAVRSGSLDGMLFPEDPVGSALQILADIDQVFPAARGQYVVGPVVKIGWGTPTLVELDAGIAIQLPDPLTISLLGSLHAALPDDAVPILVLHSEIAGTADLTAGTLKVDASLSGSQVAGLLVTGDLAVRAELAGCPTLLVAVGGFHPDFDAPADFPELAPVGIALDTGDDLRLTLGGYFALTSNTLQFGARAELWVSAAGFTAEGGTSFDALLTFEPLAFSIDVRAWVSVSAMGQDLLAVQLSGAFDGPNPFRLSATATVRIMGVAHGINVEATLGDREPDPLPAAVDVEVLLRAALERDDAWSVLEPAGGSGVVVSEPGDGLAVHPAGRVRVSQRVVPLDTTIERFGTAALAGADRFEVEAVGVAADDVEGVMEWFAAGHFFVLGEDEQLSAPSFAEFGAGLVVGRSGADAPPARTLTFDHEVAYEDPAGRDGKPDGRRPVRAASGVALTRALAGRPVASSPGGFTVASQTAYAVADALSGVRAAGTSPAGFFTARTALLEGHGAERVLVPEHELELLG